MSAKYDVALREARKNKPDLERVFKLLNEASTNGDACAAYALGTWYLHGKHVRKNRTKAVAFLQVAADAKIPDAISDLAICYEKGAGVRKNLKQAYELYLTAAIWGHRKSVRDVGRCLYYGLGTRKNRRLSEIWLERAGALKGSAQE